MRAGLNIILRGSLDPDALAYCLRSGATDRRAVSDFFRGLKGMGVWERIVFWPARASQNAGTGSTIYSAGGLARYDATMANGPTWADDGVRLVATSSQYCQTMFVNSGNGSIISVFQPTGGTANNFETPIGFQDSGAAISRNGTSGAFGYGVPNVSPPTLTQSVAQSEWSMIVAAGFSNAVNRETSKNGANLLTVGGNSSIGPNSLIFGRHTLTGFYFTGTIAFNAFSSVRLDVATIAALYSLYKATLGKGLGLP